VCVCVCVCVCVMRKGVMLYIKTHILEPYYQPRFCLLGAEEGSPGICILISQSTGIIEKAGPVFPILQMSKLRPQKF
jgi:hypothetical protein